MDELSPPIAPQLQVQAQPPHQPPHQAESQAKPQAQLQAQPQAKPNPDAAQLQFEAASAVPAPAAKSLRQLQLVPQLGPPLVMLRDTERSLRRRTVTTLQPLLSETLAQQLTQTSAIAETNLDHLANIDLASITNRDLRTARLQMGLLFVGFSALLLLLLALYFQSLEPHTPLPQQIRHHWLQYISLISLGVAGMFMLGREAMRPAITLDEPWAPGGDRSRSHPRTGARDHGNS